MSATVAVQVGRANGSGVIIDDEGHVLTAAHVAGQPGRMAIIYLSDGREARGVTLGMNQELDAGMIRISDPGAWPHAPLGSSATVREGEFCLATGHPGGYDVGRPPVLRWGRVLKNEPSALLTDCTLVGGDSGGPLFNLDGKVIGIHSRIGKNLTINVHVPIDPFRSSWDRLAQGEIWGLLDSEEKSESASADGASPRERRARQTVPPPPQSGGAWLGVVEDRTAQDVARVQSVAPGSPADLAGLQPGDIILSVDETAIGSFAELQSAIRRNRPGAIVTIHARRDQQVYELRARLKPH